MDAIQDRVGRVMHAGQLRNIVTIEKRGEGYDEAGQPVTTWSTFATVRCDVRHLSGTETIKADALTPAVRTSIRIRWLEGVTAGMRAQVESSVYEMRAVVPGMGRRRVVGLGCETAEGHRG